MRHELANGLDPGPPVGYCSATMERLDEALEGLCINTLRFLAVDAVEKARSGHPGMPMGAATAAFVLWHDFLRLDPGRLDWLGRDRFVLSAGHASALLYALLHCTGTGLELDELARVRQWGSRTPGHPEVGLTPGVETTTGPLGQGFANGVGMALAARLLAARAGPQGAELFGQRVFALVSDGDLHEGITQEAAALAGHLRLGSLVYVYDSNGITIEGASSIAWSEDVGARFAALGWHVEQVDGHDASALRGAIGAAIAETGRPSLVVSRSHIGYGSPKQDSAACHGSPLGAEALAETRRRLGWPHEELHVPEPVRGVWNAWAERGRRTREDWEARFAAWKAGAPEAPAVEALLSVELPEDLLEQLAAAVGGAPGATRSLSGKVLQRAAELVPSLIGGSADLAPSNNTELRGAGDVAAAEGMVGRNLRFGIREHAMAAIATGMTLHGPWRPYCGTFLVFSDYMRGAMRLAALSEQPVVYVLTHDSFFVGEDGPTHQPVEHLWALRVVPGLTVYRPADGLEVAAAWTAALESTGSPHVLALSRQDLPALPRPEGFDPRTILRGGYPLVEAEGGPADVTIVATGSEVAVALEARGLLRSEQVRARVVSMPCVERFLAQDRAWRDAVLPPRSRLVAVEAGVTLPWHAVVGRRGLVVGLDRFGASAPGNVLRDELGFRADQVAARIVDWIRR